MGSIGAELYGRTALVVGGAHGIGRDIALDLAASGARVAIVSSSRGQADKASRAAEWRAGLAASQSSCPLGSASVLVTLDSWPAARAAARVLDGRHGAARSSVSSQQRERLPRRKDHP
jgi:NAD(P)-dependent dehydrogenase (short-subunit alcohol dehydrogenase family)